MSVRTLLLLLGAGGISLLLLNPVPADTDPTAAATDGVEALARGPVHEGYAQPVDSQPQASPVVPKEPPAALDELPPDQKPEGDNVQWVPGYWQWDDERT